MPGFCYSRIIGIQFFYSYLLSCFIKYSGYFRKCRADVRIAFFVPQNPGIIKMEFMHIILTDYLRKQKSAAICFFVRIGQGTTNTFGTACGANRFSADKIITECIKTSSAGIESIEYSLPVALWKFMVNAVIYHELHNTLFLILSNYLSILFVLYYFFFFKL